MDCIMAVLVKPSIADELGNDNDSILQYISEQNDDEICNSITEIINKVQMDNVIIVGEYLGAIY